MATDVRRFTIGPPEDRVETVAVDDVRAVIDEVYEDAPYKGGVEHDAGWRAACDRIEACLGLEDDRDERKDG